MTEPDVGPELEEFAQQIADGVESFLVSLQALSREEDAGTVVPLLLVEVSQILFTGARLGAQRDFAPTLEYQPDVGPEPDLDAMRLRLARLLDSVDTYTFNFDPYVPEITTAQLSDDLTSIASDLANGMRHFRAGDVSEALWWWQFSYVATWGNNASAVLRALQSVVAHDRLDTDFESESDQIAAAEAVLDTGVIGT
ncbi:MAG: hypothetical protein JWR90_1254 [Marmoricola sp.]|nr:hypothetical protein [Marmoricola sp.]